MEQELIEFKRFLFATGLHKEPRGKRWLTAIEASLGDVLTHTLAPSLLRMNPEWGMSHLDRLLGQTPPTDPLLPHVRLAWGTMIRKGGEHAARAGFSARRVGRLFGRALIEYESAFSSLGADDLLKMHAAAELMAITGDIQTLAPSLASELSPGQEPFLDMYDRSTDLAARVGSRASLIIPLLLEFKVRWTVRRLSPPGTVDAGEYIAAPVFRALDDDLREADAVITQVGNVAHILEINAAVTRVNLLRAGGYPIPDELSHTALRLVTRAGDSSQAYRLQRGNQGW